MKFLALSLFLASPAFASCPNIAGKYSCTIGLPFAINLDISASPQKEGILYSANGNSILVDGKEHAVNQVSPRSGTTFVGITYSGTCQNGALQLQAVGKNLEKNVEGNAQANIFFSPRGQLAVQIAARWGATSRKMSVLCTPQR